MKTTILNFLKVITCLIFSLFLLSCSKDQNQQDCVNSIDNSQFYISKLQAINEVQNFLKNFEMSTKSGAFAEKRISHVESVAQPHITRSLNISDTLLHIVNFENDGGYAIVAADSRVSNVLLAVVDEGNMSAEEFNNELEGYEALPDEMKNVQIYDAEHDDYLIGNNSGFVPHMISEYIKIRVSMYDEHKHIGDDPLYSDDEWFTFEICWPFLETKWHQDPPFNNYYPKVGIGKNRRRADAGCVPVAVAQIIVHNEFPVNPVFNGVSCDYKLMKSDNPINLPEDAKHMIASMMKKIAERCECMYFSGGTFAFPHNVVNGVLRPYGYTKVDLVKNYNNGANDNIKKRINGMLFNNKPVFFSALSTSIFRGHAWVVDGYLLRHKRGNRNIVETFYHCNMGWGGTKDGYYNSSLFDTKAGPVVKGNKQEGLYNNNFRIITYEINK